MCSIFFGKSCDERTLGEKCMILLTVIALLAFFFTCVTFAICTYDDEMKNFGFTDDAMGDNSSDTNWTRTQSPDEIERNSAALMMFEMNRIVFICNLNIISKSWFVTTAHCINQVNLSSYISNLIVRAGVLNFNEPGMDRKVETLIVHPSYDTNIFLNNIGLVKVFHPLDISYGNYPFDLLSTRDINFRKNDVINVFGWGKNAYDDDHHDPAFRTLQFYLIDNGYCANLTHKINKLLSTDICGYQYAARSGICHPSEGAGVIGNGKLIALSSWGERCIGDGLPHIFCEIAPYITWMLAIVAPQH